MASTTPAGIPTSSPRSCSSRPPQADPRRRARGVRCAAALALRLASPPTAGRGRHARVAALGAERPQGLGRGPRARRRGLGRVRATQVPTEALILDTDYTPQVYWLPITGAICRAR